MTGAIISLVISVYIASRVRPQIRYWMFPVLVLFLLPMVAYVVIGTQRYMATMTGEMILRDMGSMSVQLFREPIYSLSMAIASPDGVVGMDPSRFPLALVGFLVILSLGMAFAQFLRGLSRPRRKRRAH